MKRIIFTTICSIICIQAISQVNTMAVYDDEFQHPAAPFGASRTVYYQNNPSVWVKIEFSIAGCKKVAGDKTHFDGTAHSYYRVINDFAMNNAIHFKFDYRTCDGKIETRNVSCSMKESKTNAAAFMYFFGTEIVKGPYDISFNDNQILHPDDKKNDDLVQKEIDKKMAEEKKLHLNPPNQKAIEFNIKRNEGGGGRRGDNTTANPQVEVMAVTSNQTSQQLEAKQKDLKTQQLNAETQQYLNNASNATTETSKAMYQAMARINATASGDKATIQIIEEQERLQKVENNKINTQNTIDLINILFGVKKNKELINDVNKAVRYDTEKKEKEEQEEINELNIEIDRFKTKNKNVTDIREVLKNIIYLNLLERLKTKGTINRTSYYLKASDSINLDDKKFISLKDFNIINYDDKVSKFENTIVFDGQAFLDDIHQSPFNIDELIDNQFLKNWYHGFYVFTGRIQMFYMKSDKLINTPWRTKVNFSEAFKYFNLTQNENLQKDIRIKDIGKKISKVCPYDKENFYFENSQSHMISYKTGEEYSSWGLLGLRQMASMAILGEIYFDSLQITKDKNYLFKSYNQFKQSLDYYYLNLDSAYKNDYKLVKDKKYFEITYKNILQNFMMITYIMITSEEYKNNTQEQQEYLKKCIEYFLRYYK